LKLQGDRHHELDFYVDQGSPSELPTIGNAAEVCKLLVSGTAMSYDPDKFQLDSAYHEVMADDYKRVTSVNVACSIGGAGATTERNVRPGAT
jgi:hypothetical protein